MSQTDVEYCCINNATSPAWLVVALLQRAVAWARGAAVALPRAAPGLREQPLRCRELRLRSWAANALSVRGMLIAISSTAILRRLQSRGADEEPMEVVLLKLRTLLEELLAPEKFAAAMGPMAAAQRARCGSRPCRPRALVAGDDGEDEPRLSCWR